MPLLDPIVKYFRYKKALSLIDELQKVTNIRKVIDIGAGDGKFANILMSKGFSVYTLDKTQGDFIVDLEDSLPFRDCEFDLAVSLAVVEHIKNYQSFLKEIKRIAKFVILTTPSPQAKYLLEFLAFLRMINREHIKDHKHYISAKELKSFGFEVKRFELGMNFICFSKIKEKGE